LNLKDIRQLAEMASGEDVTDLEAALVSRAFDWADGHTEFRWGPFTITLRKRRAGALHAEAKEYRARYRARSDAKRAQ